MGYKDMALSVSKKFLNGEIGIQDFQRGLEDCLEELSENDVVYKELYQRVNDIELLIFAKEEAERNEGVKQIAEGVVNDLS